MVELENQKADFVGEEDGELLFKNPVTFDEIKVKSDDVSDKLRPWLRGTLSPQQQQQQQKETSINLVGFTKWAIVTW